jgi:hypothetical protein
MRRSVALLIPAVLALVLAACGDDTETPATPAATPPAATGGELTVEVTKAGGGPRTYSCGDGCDPAAVAEALAGTEDAARACTEIYGGPETAHVTGTLEREAVDVTITRNNGCGIADYEALFTALGVEPPIAR